MSSALSPLRINNWLSKETRGKSIVRIGVDQTRGISPTPMIRRRWYRCFGSISILSLWMSSHMQQKPVSLLVSSGKTCNSQPVAQPQTLVS